VWLITAVYIHIHSSSFDSVPRSSLVPIPLVPLLSDQTHNTHLPVSFPIPIQFIITRTYQYCTSTVCIDTYHLRPPLSAILYTAIPPAFKSETQIAWTRPGPRLGPFPSAFSNLVILPPFHYTRPLYCDHRQHGRDDIHTNSGT
jgi:hypothetical protein